MFFFVCLLALALTSTPAFAKGDPIATDDAAPAAKADSAPEALSESALAPPPASDPAMAMANASMVRTNRIEND